MADMRRFQAHNYEMNGMEERIIGVLELTGLMEKIPGLEFFELAEKLYPDDAEDVEDDEFAKHFNKVSLFSLLHYCHRSRCAVAS